MRGWMVCGLAVMACLAAPGARAGAPESRIRQRDAAALQAAFDHDLCTRDDRALRKLTRALGRRPPAAP